MKNTWPRSIWRNARNHSKSETSKLQKQWDLYIPTSISLSLFLPIYIYFRSIFALDWQKTSELCNTNERSGEMGTLTLMCQAQMWTCTTRPTSVRPSMFITDKPGIPLLGIHPKGFTSKSTSGFCWGFSWLHCQRLVKYGGCRPVNTCSSYKQQARCAENPERVYKDTDYIKGERQNKDLAHTFYVDSKET